MRRPGLDRRDLDEKYKAERIAAGRFAIWDRITPREGIDHPELYQQHLDETCIAEECGSDHYWFFEHHVSSNAPIPSPNLMVAAAAARTSRIRLSNMVNVLP